MHKYTVYLIIFDGPNSLLLKHGLCTYEKQTLQFFSLLLFVRCMKNFETFFQLELIFAV